MHPFPKFPGHPDLPISVSHLLALLLFTSPLLPLMIKLKKHKCLQGAEAFRHVCADTESSVPQRGKEEVAVRKHAANFWSTWELLLTSLAAQT